jgi:[ribosomal protein S18]-alanine N-acetyltransferase
MTTQYKQAAEHATSDIRIERMRWWHIPEVRVIERTVFPDTAWTENQFWGELAHVPDSRDYVVAMRGTEVIGYAGLNFLSPESDIQTIAVAPQAQGQSLGRRLLEHMLDVAIQRGCTQMFLEVMETNASAIAMYDAHGFERIQVRRDYYGPGMHGIVMKRALKSAQNTETTEIRDEAAP